MGHGLSSYETIPSYSLFRFIRLGVMAGSYSLRSNTTHASNLENRRPSRV